MKRHHRGTFLLIALALAALLAGCWGSEKSTSLEVSGGGTVLAGATAVGIDKCHNCHAATAVGGVGIFAAWEASRHANLDNSFDAWDNALGTTNYHGFRTTSTSASCIPCHNPNGDNVNLPFYLSTSTDPLANTERNVVGCEACHGGGSLHFGVGPIGGPTLGIFAVAATTGQSSQYNTCTGCHEVSSPNHSEDYRRIVDTHSDNASRAVGSDIQGYVIRKAAVTACVDCHNPHTLSLALNRQWASSAHGDFAGEGWKHYDWKQSNRASCQRCHTTTGVINYLTSPSTYNSANNVFSWTSDVTTDNSSEMLYCYGCHTNYYGGLRNPGAITASYTGVSPEPTFPDSKASNICLSCHTGRESGDSVKASAGPFNNLSFINSHYLTAGGTVFAVTGYEYASRDYSIPSADLHDKIGLGTTGNAVVDTNYKNGPCVSCHFDSRDPNRLSPLTRYSDNTLSHTLSPLTRYADNDLVLNPVCINCHPTRGQGSNAGILWLGDDATAATLQGTTHKARYQAALEALKVQLAGKGFYFINSYPYFFKSADNNASANAVKNWLSPGDTDTAGDNTGKTNMGAAFNYNLLLHDPGGVAHNRRYTRRLIYDSIDWLDDGVLNYSVSATLNALDGATTYKASAISYLLQAQNGDAGDRY
ncbi:MAG: hypothetical protein HZA60_02500 [Deltaproteobacteria bacterium]|nr:hypothetical protein [Deltaproteobacteria bacterium]